MALTENQIIDNISVLEDGQLQVRTATVIKRDGEEVSRSFHRHVIAPGEDVSAEQPRVKAIAAAVHTRSVVDAYIAAAVEAANTT